METQNTPNWQVSILDTFDIVKEKDDIAQSIYLILTTIKGSDPLRPDFGSDIYKYIDKPMNMSEPMMVAEVYDAVGRWEKRIRITRCRIRAVDFDKKEIAIVGFIVGSAEPVDIDFTLFKDENDNVVWVNALFDPDKGVLANENNYVIIL